MMNVPKAIVKRMHRSLHVSWTTEGSNTIN